ncbi:hypothetical protein MAR_025557 [Mya arenaria]|uniref:Uncharacterized protein n=1 Tax=Mya arenaria TaxID=6604 RepID=A0ABY7EN05_MYAAR|nr:hypothetical protein MAR_025557 [Mya arenaria]
MSSQIDKGDVIGKISSPCIQFELIACMPRTGLFILLLICEVSNAVPNVFAEPVTSSPFRSLVGEFQNHIRVFR